MQRSKVFLFFFALVASTAASPALFDDLDVSLDDDNNFLEEGESHSLGKNEELQVGTLILTGVNLGRQLCNKPEFSTFEVVNTTVKAGTKDFQVTILASNDKEKRKFTATLRQETGDVKKNGQWSIVSQIKPNACSERKAAATTAAPAVSVTTNKKDEDEEGVEEEDDHLLEDPLDFLDEEVPVAAKKKKARVNVNSKDIIPDELVSVDVNRADVQAAKNHVFEQIQLGRKGCKKPVYKSVRVLQALVQPGAGTEYVLEFEATPSDAKEKPRNFAASIRRLPKYKNRFHASTGAPKEWNTLQLSPEPCSSATLAYSLSEIAAHNANPSSTYQAKMYPEMLHATKPLWGFGTSEIDFDSIPADKIEHIDVEALQMAGPLPDSYDYRKVAPDCAAVKEILSQGTCGSCYAQAAATVYGAALHKNTKGRYNIKLSAREGADCTKGCAGGFGYNVWEYMKSGPGIVEEYCDPETRMPGQCGPKCGAAPLWKVQDYKVLGLKNLAVDVAEKALMLAVSTYGPIWIGFRAYTGFQNYQFGVYTVPDGAVTVGGHAVTLLGWGVDPVGGKYWILQNSYSEYWGMNGYFFLRRGENTASIESFGAMFVTPVNTPTGEGASCTTRCKNMGTLKADCSCSCPGMWSGADCGTCQPATCQNGGTFNRYSCACDCPPGRAGNDCSQARVLLNTNKVCTDGSGAPMTMSWTAPSSVGSFCKVFDTLRLETGVTQLFCGAEADWSMQNANCPQTGSVQFDMTALRGLPYGNYRLRCAQYMGTNEFKQSKGYEWIDDKADLAKFDVTTSGCGGVSAAAPAAAKSSAPVPMAVAAPPPQAAGSAPTAAGSSFGANAFDDGCAANGGGQCGEIKHCEGRYYSDNWGCKQGKSCCVGRLLAPSTADSNDDGCIARGGKCTAQGNCHGKWLAHNLNCRGSDVCCLAGAATAAEEEEDIAVDNSKVVDDAFSNSVFDEIEQEEKGGLTSSVDLEEEAAKEEEDNEDDEN